MSIVPVGGLPRCYCTYLGTSFGVTVQHYLTPGFDGTWAGYLNGRIALISCIQYSKHLFLSFIVLGYYSTIALSVQRLVTNNLSSAYGW